MNSAHPHRRLSALEVRFFALVLFLSLLSLASIALLSVESFTSLWVLVAAVASLLPAAFFLVRCSASLNKLSRFEWGVVFLVVVAFVLRSNVAIVVYGGQDPGVYTNIASDFVEHGSWIIKDHLLDEFEGRPDLREYYVTKSLRGVTKNSEGGWVGNMVPGVYLKKLDRNEWVAQFYHVNTVWLAIGQWMFGQEWKGLPLALFSSFTLIAAYIITVRISSSPAAGLVASFLLATNAAHSYIGTFPVSEAVAGFFFLSGLSMLTAQLQFSSVLPFAALFLTRITGFLTAPLVLISLAWMVVKRKDARAVWTGLGILGAYGLSVVWGLHFSGPYSMGIYQGKLGIQPSLLEHVPDAFLAIGLVWSICCFLALRYRCFVKPLCSFILRYRTQLVIALISLILTVTSYRGYLLAFTNHYVANHWLGVRWHMAGQGVESLKYLTIYSLSLMLSPLGFVVFLVGLGYVGRLATKKSVVAPVAICSLGFFAALTCKQLTTPYLYYFGRYLVSELLPLAIVCAAIAIHLLARRLPRRKYVVAALYCLCVFALLYPSLRARLKIREGQQFFEAMSCIDQATPGRSVVFIDKKNFPETPVVTALRFSFQKPTFAISEKEYSQPEKLKDWIDYFTSKGYAVYLLSSSDTWQSKEGFTKLFRISAIMRRVNGKAEAPTRIRTFAHPLRLYSLQGPGPLPEICQRVKEYSK